MLDLFFYLFFFGLAGARLVFIIFEAGYYLRHPLSIFNISGGGLAIHGAILGGFFGGYIFSRRHDIRLALLADIIAPALILGQAIGRIGCFLNGDSFGKLTSVSWAVVFEGVPGLRHPTQLYEAFFNLGLFILIILIRDKKPFTGSLFIIYLIGYSIIRIFVEIFRESQIFFGPVTYAQAASVIIILVSVYLLFNQRKKINSNPNN